VLGPKAVRGAAGEGLGDGWCFGRESVEAALDAVARGEFVVVVDDEDRENEGDLIAAADKVTPASIAFMVRHTSGVICCSMEGADLDRLELAQMVRKNTDPKNTAFTVTCDYKHGTSTGISAADRAASLRALADPHARVDDFHRPGHIFPLRYVDGGVLKRAGHTEAALDFARLAGCAPVGVLSEIVNDSDGSMARLPDLRVFAKEHGLVLTSIADLVQYRRLHERLVVRVGAVPARLPTRYGDFDAYCYRSVQDGVEHLALVVGGAGPGKDSWGDDPVLVRVHSECCTGDVFGSLRCDCGPQLDFAMRKIVEEGRGVLVYLRGQEGRGIGLGHKMRAYALQDQGMDTVEANVELGLPVDSREYGIGAQMLADLGLRNIRVMTNNPRKYSGLSGYGLTIVERVPVQISPNPANVDYLRTKREKLGHWLAEGDGPLKMTTAEHL
jgi:3,4-dihydroxy 2-butanone 4-phosphate synthase / GTP cyclohydrolase II